MINFLTNFRKVFFWFLANKTLIFSPIHIILSSLKVELSELNNHMSGSYVSSMRVVNCQFKVEQPMINFLTNFRKVVFYTSNFFVCSLSAMQIISSFYLFKILFGTLNRSKTFQTVFEI